MQLLGAGVWPRTPPFSTLSGWGSPPKVLSPLLGPAGCSTLVGDGAMKRRAAMKNVESTAGSAPAVPLYPVLSAEVDEEGVAWFQGHRVELAEGEEPASAIVRLAAESAAAREGAVKAVRVRASSGGSVWSLVVDASGEVWDAPTVSRSAVSRRQKAGLVALLTGVLVIPVGGAASIVGSRMSDSEPSTRTVRTVTVAAPSATATQLPVLSPSGEQMVAMWSSDALGNSGAGSLGASSTSSPAVALGSCVATVMRSGRDSAVRCLRADNGAQVWSVRVEASGTSLWPSGDGVVVTSSSQVRVLDARGRTRASRTLGNGERPLLLGSGVAVQVSRTTVLIDQAGRWVPRVVPAGASVVGTHGEAAVVADRSGQVWSVTDGRVAPAAARLAAPVQGAKPAGVLGLTPDGFLYGWESPAKELVVQRFRVSAPTRPVMTARVPGGTGVGSGWSASTVSGKAVVSPGGRLAVIEDYLVDLASGQARVLPKGWLTTRVLDEQVFGQASGSSVVVDAQGRTLWSVDAPSGVDVGVPAAQISGVSFIPASVGSETRLYATRTVLPGGAGSASSPSSVPSSTATSSLPSGRSATAQTPSSSVRPSSTASKGGGAK